MNIQRIGTLVSALFLISVSAAAVAEEPVTQKSPGQMVDDATVTTKVKAAFVNDPEVSALDVKVRTYKGTVQLSGFASSQKEIERAGTLARSVGGVKNVENDIRLKPPAR